MAATRHRFARKRFGAWVVACLLGMAAGSGWSASADDAMPPALGGWGLDAVRVGVLEHATRLTSSGREGGVDLNIELAFATPWLWWLGPAHPFIGISVNPVGRSTDQLYFGLAWRAPLGRRFFYRLGGGGAVHNGVLFTEGEDRRSLGSRALFHLSLEAGWQLSPDVSLSLYHQHISNGPFPGRNGVNDGLDNTGLRVGYHFFGG